MFQFKNFGDLTGVFEKLIFNRFDEIISETILKSLTGVLQAIVTY